MAAIAMLGAIAANVASAENVTDPARWYVNGVGLNAGQSEKVKCSKSSESLVLEGTVGEGTEKVPAKLTASGIECINHEGTSEGNGSARIEQTGNGTTEAYAAEDFGRLVFTGVTVTEPAHCKVSGGAVTTNPLKSQLLMDKAKTGITFDRFIPTGTNFATVKIESDGTGTCGIAGSRVAKGAACGQAANETGTFATNQKLSFSATVDATAGNTEDSCELLFAGNPAHLTGTVNNELAGANAGKSFGAKNE